MFAKMFRSRIHSPVGSKKLTELNFEPSDEPQARIMINQLNRLPFFLLPFLKGITGISFSEERTRDGLSDFISAMQAAIEGSYSEKEIISGSKKLNFFIIKEEENRSFLEIIRTPLQDLLIYLGVGIVSEEKYFLISRFILLVTICWESAPKWKGDHSELIKESLLIHKKTNLFPEAKVIIDECVMLKDDTGLRVSMKSELFLKNITACDSDQLSQGSTQGNNLLKNYSINIMVEGDMVFCPATGDVEYSMPDTSQARDNHPLQVLAAGPL